MEQVGKWEVTYTKHLKKKRKVYQDGFLIHLLYNNKVMLYDEFEKLVDSKLLKKDESINTGDSFLFPSFLVDIGPSILLPNHTPTPHKSTNTFPKFKKNQLVKYTPSTATPSSSSSSSSSSKEWEALYTTHITQKAKKYHDGFLRLFISASQGRQVALYDSNKNQIDKRFLNKDQVICSGETLKLDGHLVDIGDPLGNKEIDAAVKTEASNCNSDKVASGPQFHKLCQDNLMYNPQRCKVPTRRNRLRTDNALVIGQAQNDVGSRKCGDSSFDGSRMKPTKTPLSHMPPRDVNHILSILKKPAAQDNVPILEKAAVYLPQSSEVVQLHNDDKPSEGIAQFDSHQATKATNKYDSDEAAKRLTADTDCSGDHPQPETTPDNTAMAQANTRYSSNNTESPVNMQGIIFESPNKSKPSVGAAPSNICQPIHLAGSMASVSPEIQKTRSTYEQPCEKLPETNASIKQGTYNPSNKLKARRLFSGLAGMKINRNNVNTEFPLGTLDCPSFDLGI